MLLAVPLVNTLLIIVFWQSQLIQYLQQTTGIVFMWLVAGLIFVLVQLSLQWDAFKKAKTEAASDKRFEVRWSLGAQIWLLGLIAVYNTVALIELLVIGVIPSQLFDILIGILIAGTMAIIAVKYRSFTPPAARLLLATGTKAAPQVLQAGAFALLGSAGLPLVAIASLTAIGGLRFLLAWHSKRHYHNSATVAAYKGAFRDFSSTLLMVVGWIIGRM